MLPLLGMLSRNALLQAAASLLSTNLQYQHTNASGNTQQACNQRTAPRSPAAHSQPHLCPQHLCRHQQAPIVLIAPKVHRRIGHDPQHGGAVAAEQAGQALCAVDAAQRGSKGCALQLAGLQAAGWAGDGA